MAKIQIPETLKQDVPHTMWGKILAATPIVMTVVATMLAGLSTSEMTKAQYDRSFAAQLQSKAGDQWGYFQAKRQRSALQRTTLDLLSVTSAIQPIDAARLKQAAATLPLGNENDQAGAELIGVLDSSVGAETLTALSKGSLPVSPKQTPLDPAIKSLIAALETSTESELAGLVHALDTRTLETALITARREVQAFDEALAPYNTTVEKIDKWLGQHPAVSRDAVRDFTAARLRYAAARYDAESRLNQTVASLLELQVRKNNLSAERHHVRSQRFFYGMLAAQLGVIMSTFAIAARQRSFLWALAAGAGIIAILFAAYVYLYV